MVLIQHSNTIKVKPRMHGVFNTTISTIVIVMVMVMVMLMVTKVIPHNVACCLDIHRPLFSIVIGRTTQHLKGKGRRAEGRRGGEGRETEGREREGKGGNMVRCGKGNFTETLLSPHCIKLRTRHKRSYGHRHGHPRTHTDHSSWRLLHNQVWTVNIMTITITVAARNILRHEVR